MQPPPANSSSTSVDTDPLIPRTAYQWGRFTFQAMVATGMLVALLFLARSSWRKGRRRAEEAAQKSSEPVDPSWRYRVTARWSWGVSVASIAITAFFSTMPRRGGLPVMLLELALVLAGPFLALHAVLGATDAARKKVLLPAAIGALIPMLMICLAVWQFMSPERPLPAAIPPAAHTHD
jgi:hypothetical protein